MVPGRRAAALPSEALYFLSCLPRGKWCSSLRKETSGCQKSPLAYCRLKDAEASSVFMTCFEEKMKVECGAKWVNCKYGGEENRGGHYGGDDGDSDDLLSSKCYVWVWHVPPELYTFTEYWFLRSLKWKYNFPDILLKGLKTRRGKYFVPQATKW